MTILRNIIAAILLLGCQCHADDWQALTDLLNASPGAVTIPPGSYSTDQPITITRSPGMVSAYGVTISPSSRFEGDGVVCILGASPRKNRVKNLHISGLAIDLKGKPYTGIFATHTMELRLIDLEIRDSPACGMILQNSWDSVIERVSVFDCGSVDQHAVEFGGLPLDDEQGTRHITVRDLRIERFRSVALSCENQKSLKIIDSKFEGVRPNAQGVNQSSHAIQFKACDTVRVVRPLMTLSRFDVSIDEGCVNVTVEGAMNRTGKISK